MSVLQHSGFGHAPEGCYPHQQWWHGPWLTQEAADFPFSIARLRQYYNSFGIQYRKKAQCLNVLEFTDLNIKIPGIVASVN